MTTSLPDQANLEQYRNQAKDLLKAHRAHDSAAALRIRESHPEFMHLSPEAIFGTRFLLADAQLVIARELGLASWVRLKREVERRQRERAQPVPPFEALLQAAMDGDLNAMRSLLARDTGLVTATDECGRTVLERSASRATSEALRLLLESGADARSVNLHNMTWWNPDLPRIELLLQHGADARQLQNHHASGSTTLLHNAAHNGGAGLARLLLRYGAADQFEAQLTAGEEGRRKGLTPLQLAAKRGNGEAAQVFIAADAPYDAFSAAALGDLTMLRAVDSLLPTLFERP